MTISKWWSIGIGILLIVLVSLGGYVWLTEHDAKLKAETQTAAEQKSVDAAKSDAAQTAAQLKQTLAALESQKSQPATPQQIILDTSKLIALAQPLTTQAATQPAAGNGPAQPGAADSAKVPQQQIVIPAADFQAIQNAEIGCQENSAKLSACALTSADLQTELKATEAQRDTWEKTAKGGSWLHKTLTAAKWVGIGVGAGYVAGRVTK
jgi:cytoskeletal protein RodZ